ncbi:LATE EMBRYOGENESIS ABUNDANT (LEA) HYDROXYPROLINE-RICH GLYCOPROTEIN FAMILY [Salix purpurea]|uniref:LATE EMBRYOGENESIS ABUNDANT (LEA) HYDROXYPROLINE-RICH GLYCOPROTEIN FAMILY n=1 Tax=Salix purpurea TaxID=77065 RepID=A0A9Q0T371_SALPP|nr:LATE EMBRYOGENESIS ABUNDANT (LEA) HYDROXYPROLINE-RICH GLYCOPROTEIN FAMILY [Salix purpurea]
MTSKASSVPYTSLPSRPDSYPQNVIVLSYYHRPPNHILRRCLLFTTAILLLSASVYLLYPSDPAIQLSRIKLNHIRVNYSPELTLDASFSLTIKVENRDFFSLYYDSLVVSVGYRGRELGFDLARGVILFDTNTQVEGDLGLLLFKIPINGRVSCQVLVNTNNQTVEHQDCYPQVRL